MKRKVGGVADMPWESIGECGWADLRERNRMVAEIEIGVRYVKLICGEPPPGCEVDVMWHEHELGEYATVGLLWNPVEIEDPPWGYMSRAETVLSRFNDSVDWSPSSEEDEDELKDDEVDDGDQNQAVTDDLE